MRSIEKAQAAELEFYDFDSLLAALHAGDVNTDATLVPLDDIDEARPYRIADYVTPPGSQDAVCPHCGLGGGVVDKEGFFTCERCDYYNWTATRENDRMEVASAPDDDSDDVDVPIESVGRSALDVYFDSLEMDEPPSFGDDIGGDDAQLAQAA